MESFLYLIIAGCASLGIILSFNIHVKKKSKSPLVCPLKFHCDTVVHSDYSTFLHIPLEYLGMFYYSLIFSSYVFLFLNPALSAFKNFSLSLIFLTTFAFFFSMYLTALQAFVLKQWCSWCLISAGLCSIIFFSAVQTSFYNMIPLLKAYHSFIMGINFFGISIGLGAVFISALFFIKFIKDLKVSLEELAIFKTFSQIIWFGFGTIIVSNFLIFISNSEILPTKFFSKMVILSVLVIVGFLLNHVIIPKLTSIPFGQTLESNEKNLSSLRRLAFALGFIAMVSWIFVFILEMIDQSPALLTTLLIYCIVILISFIISQILEHVVSLRKIVPEEV